MRREILKKAEGSGKILTRIFAAMLAIAMLAALSFVTGTAASAAEETSTAALQVRFHHQEENARPIPGAVFHLYQVVTPDETGAFAYTAAFAACGVEISRLNSPDDALMFTLAGWAQGTNAPRLAEGKTDETGRVNFRKLPGGVYLVIGFPVTLEDTVYTPQPFLVSLPEGEQVTVEPKFTMETIPKEGPSYIERRVLKIWEDEGYEKQRPEEITVQLLRDGEVYDEVTLNAENGWRHVWDSLPIGYLYLIYEKTVPENYTALVDRQGITFTVTNSYQPPENPPETPGTPGDNPPKLPQTGLLWWPVPLLVGGGVLLLAGGILLSAAGTRARRPGEKKGQKG